MFLRKIKVVMKNITILGFFGKKNLGDDFFYYAFKGIEELYKNEMCLTLTEPSEVKGGLVLSEDTDVLVCGGGDICTDYFMLCVHRLKTDYEEKTGRRLPVHAISIGISFPENINETRSHYLDIFDHIIFRNKTDYDMLLDRYGTNRITYLPDLAFIIPRLYNFAPAVQKGNNGILLICLAQAMDSGGTNTKYNMLVQKLTDVLNIAGKKWNLVFMSFMTCLQSKSQCDIYLNRAIQQGLTCENTTMDVTDIEGAWNAFQTADRIFAMRFHAHVLALSTSTPIVSLSMTNKTENLMIEAGLESCMVRMIKPSRKLHHPEDFDHNLTVKLLMSDDLPVPASPDTPEPIRYFKEVLEEYVSNKPPMYLPPERVSSDIDKVVNVIASAVCRHLDVTFDPDYHPSELKRLRTISRFYYRISNGVRPDKEKVNQLTNILVALIELALTGNDSTDFKYGLTEQLWSLELSDGIEWILNKLSITEGLPINSFMPNIDTPMSSKTDITSPETCKTDDMSTLSNVSINLDYVPQQLSKGCHRSGWNYVIQGLKDAYNDPTSSLILDGYLDKTFHWSRDIAIELKRIPYKCSWIGFIHHTPDELYTEYNTTALVNDTYFKDSLPFCKGLIVMSHYLRNWLVDQGLKVPIYCLTHPTQIVDKQFSLDAFFKNRRITQIGGWLRDSYGIYALSVDEKVISKCALKGKGLENYYSLNNLELWSSDMTSTSNKHYTGLKRHVESVEGSVTIIDKLSNDEYDDLLASSIVFLKLEDASACNTVIECIVRNTPVLVNRLPALEEVLGEEYPFFYDSLYEAGVLASNSEVVVNTNIYLQNRSKKPFELSTFLHEFGNIITDIQANIS